MLYIAFTIGLFGSLHCVGMCGPLAIAFAGGGSKKQALLSGMLYHLGRSTTYVLLGIFFGLVGNAMVVAGLQKWLSIVIGILMVISFLVSLDIDRLISNSTAGKKWRGLVTDLVQRIYSKTTKQPKILLGMVNGLLPCGLVYLALAGSLASPTVWSGGLFMLLFGLGTIPAMIALTLGNTFTSQSIRRKLQKVLPYVTLCFGLFMIYRGLVVDMPAELDFWTAIKHPVMCH